MRIQIQLPKLKVSHFIWTANIFWIRIRSDPGRFVDGSGYGIPGTSNWIQDPDSLYLANSISSKYVQRTMRLVSKIQLEKKVQSLKCSIKAKIMSDSVSLRTRTGISYSDTTKGKSLLKALVSKKTKNEQLCSLMAYLQPKLHKIVVQRVWKNKILLKTGKTHRALRYHISDPLTRSWRN